MPNVEREQEITASPPAFPEGAFCVTTKRIVVISPFPAMLQPLVTEMMTRCYDVLLFHSEKEPILPLLQNDLVIVDRSWGTEGADEAIDAGNGSDVLYLVNANARKTDTAAPVLAWPSDLETAVAKIEEMASQSKPLADSLPGEIERLRFRDVEMDLKRMVVLKAGTRIELTKTEFDLLKLLLSSEGVLTRQAIMEAIWGDNYFGGSNSVDVHVKSLRQKLGDDPRTPAYIATVRGVGYRIAD